MQSTKDQTDEAGFDSIRRKLARAVAAVSPHLGAAEREDVVQAACLRLLKIKQRSEGDRDFNASYLWRAAYSALIDEIRRLRRRREDPLDAEMIDRATYAAGDPENETVWRQVGSVIQDCLLRLVRDRRLAVTLYLQGHKVPQAAELLGWGRKRVENLVFRGLADLRQCLIGKGVQP